MRLERFIARRIVGFGNRSGDYPVSPPAVRISIAGITLGLATMILAVAVVTGFKQEVRDKVIGFDSHIQITNFDSNMSYETSPVLISDTLLSDLRAYPGVRHVEAFATKLGILKTETDFHGIVLKGIGTDYDWTFFGKHLKEGAIFTVDSQQMSTSVLVSVSLANLLGLQCGDSFSAYFLQDNDVRTRKFRISGLYDTGYTDYDKLFVVADIRQVRRLNNWDDNAVSGLGLYVSDYSHIDPVCEQLFFRLIDKTDLAGNTLYVRSIKELNPMIFNWLSVLDVNVVIILVLMMAVAGFTMISGLLIIILERTGMIGVLKALGQTDGSIRKVFLHTSAFLTLRGMCWGNVIALVICFIQWRFRLITLDPSTYYLDAVPIALDAATWLLINAGALMISLLMMLIPSCLIMKISPIRSIRFE